MCGWCAVPSGSGTAGSSSSRIPRPPCGWSRALEEEAERLGAELTVLDAPVIAEVVYQRLNPALVVGAFSTALLTASAFYGIPVARIGTDTLLSGLTPYQNSNRVPLTIVDALLPDLEDPAEVTAWSLPDENTVQQEFTGLVTAVGFAMQPKIYPQLRPAAEAFLARQSAVSRNRYFRRRRLTALALPGALPSQFDFLPRNPTVRRFARQARTWQRAASRRMPGAGRVNGS